TSGIAPARIAAPVLATAGALSLVALLLNETIVLRTARRMDGGQDGGELFQSRGAFWYQRGGNLFEIQGADRASQTLQGVVIYDRDANGRLVRSVKAERAHIEADRRWRLEHALFREFPRDDPESAPHTEQRESAYFELGTAGDLALLGADPH